MPGRTRWCRRGAGGRGEGLDVSPDVRGVRGKQAVLPWGKHDKESGAFHRLEHHCADVAACFEALLDDRVFRDRFRKAAGQAYDLCDVTLARLTVLAFLHDFGKLNAGFQFKLASDRTGLPPKAGHIPEALWCCEQPEYVTAMGLDDMAQAWGYGPFEQLLRASLAHHGRPAVRRDGNPPALWQATNGYDPLTAARMLGEKCRSWFPRAFMDGPELPDAPQLAHLFAGTLGVADQIGSNEQSFPYEPVADATYIDRARSLARKAVSQLGFGRDGRAARLATIDVGGLFGYDSPRPLQTATLDASIDQRLVILESETGSGKTEAAILRFAALWSARRVDGLYFAVPTRAAAKQLHRRVHKALLRLFGDHRWNETVLAIPGYRIIVGTAEGRRKGRFEVEWQDAPDEDTRQARWAAEAARKFLCATSAVGTVDQALLAGLQAKWAHYRGAALARSLLVVDEVHASDTYMTEVLRGVVRDHLAVGGHALLMSATLGSVARVGLTIGSTGTTRRISPPARPEAEQYPYPVLTLAGNGKPPVVDAIEDWGVEKSVSVSAAPVLTDPGQIAEEALSRARDGAKVLVVRNTVRSAVQVYEAVRTQGGKELLLQVGGLETVHHSRFAAEDRERLDEAVEASLGKSRPDGGRVVVGTQTLEQSLDIDADYLISDLCPMDVLLQRIGRLHRHSDNRDRPDSCSAARCLVLTPPGGLESGLDGGLARYGLGSRRGIGVYRNLLVLEATRRQIVGDGAWRIPAMNRQLVERATHPEVEDELATSLGGRWVASEQEEVGRRAQERLVARCHALDRNQPFDGDLAFPGTDEKVRTRLGEDACRIRVPDFAIGPFGTPIRTFSLPDHFFRGGLPSREAVEQASVAEAGGVLVLRVGDRSFDYDRCGIRPSRH